MIVNYKQEAGIGQPLRLNNTQALFPPYFHSYDIVRITIYAHECATDTDAIIQVATDSKYVGNLLQVRRQLTLSTLATYFKYNDN